MGDGWLKTGRQSQSTVHVGHRPAGATDDMVVVIAHARLEARRPAGRLYLPHQPRPRQGVQHVVDGLGGEGAEPCPGSRRDGVSIWVAGRLGQQSEDGETGRGDPQASPPQKVLW